MSNTPSRLADLVANPSWDEAIEAAAKVAETAWQDGIGEVMAGAGIAGRIRALRPAPGGR